MNIDVEFSFTDNREEFLEGLEDAILCALERCGQQAESYAQDLCPERTGNLKNSISHTVMDDSAYVGTNSEYGPYVELGTGKYYPGGRQDPWVYRDDAGNWHTTSGQPAQPFLKPAIADYKGTYRNIIKNELSSGK